MKVQLNLVFTPIVLMQRLKRSWGIFLLCLLVMNGNLLAQESQPRTDGRMVSSYAIVRNMLKEKTPRLAYRFGKTRKEFAQWQDSVRVAMQELMQFPQVTGQPAPVCVKKEKRDTYTLEKWEFYPFPKCVSTFLVLIPDHLKKPVPGILCIPGAGRTKEGLAGESGTYACFSEDYQNPRTSMALDMVKQGYIAVAVDNAAAGEAADLEGPSGSCDYDYDLVSRYLLEMGWSWLGYTSYLDYQVLQWMKTQSNIQQDRIVVSGFSLGTEPMMVLGVLDKDIYAFVYNDFLCQTKERAEVLTKPDEKGRRRFPNSIRHLIPRYWDYFNFPDVVAALAPRHLILTEGGLDRDFRLVKSAYKDCGAPDNVKTYHYKKFAEPSKRKDVEKLPEGLSASEFFEAANVDTQGHYFKHELVMPWLKSILQP